MMFHSLMIFLALIAAVFVSEVRTAPAQNSVSDTCNTHFYSYSSCGGTISTSGGCTTAKINLANSDISTCESVGLFWSYPTDNLTVTFDSLLSQQRQPYRLEFDNGQMRGAISRVFRVLNGEETEVTTTDDKLIVPSDSNYQVVLKFQGPPSLFFYGVFINYDVIKMPSH